jgi:hypothetical protein
MPVPPSVRSSPNYPPHSPENGPQQQASVSRYRDQPVDFTDLDSEAKKPEPKQPPVEAPAPRLLAATVVEVILFLLYLSIPNTRLYENNGVVASENYTGDDPAKEGQTLDGVWFGCTFCCAALAFWPARSESFPTRLLSIIFLKFTLGFVFAYRIASASAFVMPFFAVCLALLLLTIVMCFIELNAVHLRLIAEDVERTRVHDAALRMVFDQLESLSQQAPSDHARADGESSISAAFRRLVSAWDFEWGRLLVSKHMNLANNVFAATCLIFFALYLGNFSSEIGKILSTQATILPSAALDALKANTASAAYSGTPWKSSRGDIISATSSSRVQLVVLDGMRFDMLTRVPDLAALLEELKDDLIVRKMRAQLPTMSVPNWITLLTGAPPEWTGVLGNLLVPETK